MPFKKLIQCHNVVVGVESEIGVLQVMAMQIDRSAPQSKNTVCANIKLSY